MPKKYDPNKYIIDFITPFYNIIQNQVDKKLKDWISIDKIIYLLNNKEKVLNKIDKDEYQGFINKVINRFDYNKELTKQYIDEFLIKYVTTLIKNSIVRYIKNKQEKNKLKEEDYINIFLFLSLFFRHNKKIDKFKLLKENIIKNNIQKDKIKEEINNMLNEQYKKSNFKEISIFKNQLIKYLSKKRKKVNDFDKVNYLNSQDWKFDHICYNNNWISSINNFNNLYNQLSYDSRPHNYHELAEEIVDELINEGIIKKNMKNEKIIKKINKLIESKKKEKWNVDPLINNFLDDFQRKLLNQLWKF